MLACGLATPDSAGASREPLRRTMIGTWLPAAVLLPPLFALIVPVPLTVVLMRRHRGIIYRHVFSAAACGLAYGAVSALAHATVAPAAGHLPPPRVAPIAWILVTAACELLAMAALNTAILIAIKGSSPATRVLPLAVSRTGARHELAVMALGVIATLTAAAWPPLTIAVIPAVILTTRHMTTIRPGPAPTS